MEEADLILDIDKRLRKASGVASLTITATIQGRDGRKQLTFTHSELAKCKDRFARWDLIRSRI